MDEGLPVNYTLPGNRAAAKKRTSVALIGAARRLRLVNFFLFLKRADRSLREAGSEMPFWLPWLHV